MEEFRVIVATVNACNIHKGLAGWALKAYVEQNSDIICEVFEGNINDSVMETVEQIYLKKPDVLGFSCYIWNIEYIKKVGSLIRSLLPKTTIILGGPEVSFEKDLTFFDFADYIVRGEGEQAFLRLLTLLKNNNPPQQKIFDGKNDAFEKLPSPFNNAYFSSFENNQINRIDKQLIYYESTRGCPFSCAYCLSSTTCGVECLPLSRVKADLKQLLANGAKCIKFVDRTFNAQKARAKEILNFILTLDTDCTFHFEVAADLFDDEMLSIIQRLPPALVQFEIGVQSVSEKVLEAVNRKTDTSLVLNTIKTLTSFGNCHIHVDLIAGLPLETLHTFKEAVNQLIKTRPHMLQLGFLKMLKGSHIRSIEFGAVYSSYPPYEVVKTDTMSYDDIIELKKLESVIERFYNSGAFFNSIDLGLADSGLSPYDFFDSLAKFLALSKANVKVSLKNAYTQLLDFLCQHVDAQKAAHAIKFDCLSFDPKGQLPDQIPHNRNKQLEQEHKSKLPKNTFFRIEFFPHDNTTRLFVYDKRHSVKNRFENIILSG